MECYFATKLPCIVLALGYYYVILMTMILLFGMAWVIVVVGTDEFDL